MIACQDDFSSKLTVTAKELANLLGVSKRHVWAMDADGRLGPRGIALGRAKRWSLQEVKDWLAAGAPNRSVWTTMYPNDSRPTDGCDKPT